jgi:hypothetical protein
MVGERAGRTSRSLYSEWHKEEEEEHEEKEDEEKEDEEKQDEEKQDEEKQDEGKGKRKGIASISSLGSLMGDDESTTVQLGGGSDKANFPAAAELVQRTVVVAA